MKIKFIKEYVSVDPSTNSGIIHRFGETEEIEGYTAEWLIDNGFAEKVEKQWPVCGDKYWYVNADGITIPTTWFSNSFDDCTAPIGNVFKAEERAQRFVDYLKAVEIVRHDEGFMKKGNDRFVYPIIAHNNLRVVSAASSSRQHAGEFYFDSYEHSNASLDKHRDEWQTILDYDWSRE